jgi:hypothetical protein
VWQVLVADSGNHAIRAVEPDGSTSTYAGTPGQAGWADHEDPLEAQFRNPQGLARDPDCQCLYVADQGNAVIRRIDIRGSVTTLAGQPGSPGDQDGPAARFTDLKGIAVPRHWQHGRRHLYVLDGHAVREVDPDTGAVTTVLGQVGTPGFREVRPGDPALGPCLNDPWDLKPTEQGFLITDRGNNAVREWNLEQGTLATVAGDPGQRGSRWGLLRDGMDLPLDETYAALDRPGSILNLTGSRWLVATGHEVVCLGRGILGNDQARAVTLDAGVAERGGACRARFTLAAAGPGEPEPISWSVDFLEPDGTLAERRTGDGFTGQAILAEGTFAQTGAGTVVARCVTRQGRSSGARLGVAIP